MTSFLFWNLNKQPLHDHVARLARAYEVDVLMLAECDATPDALRQSLNAGGKPAYNFPASESRKVQVFTRFQKSRLVEKANVFIAGLNVRLLKVGPLPRRAACGGPFPRQAWVGRRPDRSRRAACRRNCDGQDSRAVRPCRLGHLATDWPSGGGDPTHADAGPDLPRHVQGRVAATSPVSGSTPSVPPTAGVAGLRPCQKHRTRHDLRLEQRTACQVAALCLLSLVVAGGRQFPHVLLQGSNGPSHVLESPGVASRSPAVRPSREGGRRPGCPPKPVPDPEGPPPPGCPRLARRGGGKTKADECRH